MSEKFHLARLGRAESYDEYRVDSLEDDPGLGLAEEGRITVRREMLQEESYYWAI